MFFKRILLISHEMTYTGAPRSLLNLALLLRSRGNYVKVATLKSGPFEKEYRKYGFIVRHYYEERYNYSLLTYKQDLVIANTIFSGNFAIQAQQYVPTILYIREARNLPRLLHENSIPASVITDAENVVCVSEYAADFIRETYHPKSIYILHNFINKKFGYKPLKNVLCDGKIHFLISGTIEERKGHDIAIKAFDILPTNISNKVVLHVVGRIPEWSHEYYESLKLDAKDNVVYHGEIKNTSKMFQLYESVNVVLIPSLDESCSLVALEGAMHGKFLLLSENVGAKYLVTENGLVIPANSVKELSDAIIYIVNNSRILESTHLVSYANFIKYSNKIQYIKKFMKIYSKIKITKRKRSLYEKNK